MDTRDQIGRSAPTEPMPRWMRHGQVPRYFLDESDVRGLDTPEYFGLVGLPRQTDLVLEGTHPTTFWSIWTLAISTDGRHGVLIFSGLQNYLCTFGRDTDK